ncbi:hypothetical protein HY251_05120 [bacterium]|nr:hypothetical protein [bacterium]
MDETIVLPDGRVACISVHSHVGFVTPEGVVEFASRYGEKIGGSAGGLAPWGDLVVVSWDTRGALVTSFDLRTGKVKGSFEALECQGAPAIDMDGTIYLDGGASGYVRG